MTKQTKPQGQYISCHLDGRNLIKKAFIMYEAKPKFLLVRLKENFSSRQDIHTHQLTDWLLTTLEIRTWKLG